MGFLIFIVTLRDLVPWSGIKPRPPVLGVQVLATGLQGSPHSCFLNSAFYVKCCISICILFFSQNSVSCRLFLSFSHCFLVFLLVALSDFYLNLFSFGDTPPFFFKMRTLLHCWWECKWIQLLWRTVWSILDQRQHADSQLGHVGSSSSTRDRTWTPCIGSSES